MALESAPDTKRKSRRVSFIIVMPRSPGASQRCHNDKLEILARIKILLTYLNDRMLALSGDFVSWATLMSPQVRRYYYYFRGTCAIMRNHGKTTRANNGFHNKRISVCS